VQQDLSMLALNQVHHDMRPKALLGSRIAEPSFALLIGTLHDAVHVRLKAITSRHNE
jgi:hypothetical protein